jgi:hypothetical protein
MWKKNYVTVAVTCLLAACAAGPQSAEQQAASAIVYPAPPDEPRFYFERTIVGSADFEIVDSETKATGVDRRSSHVRGFFETLRCRGLPGNHVR